MRTLPNEPRLFTLRTERPEKLLRLELNLRRNWLKKKKEKKDHLRQLAEKARNERAGLKTAANLDKNEEILERDRRSRLQRERERDVSEQIALGLPAKNVNLTGDASFD
ncbi:hypothetical protein TKK_0009099 [Trichogramma kaykai]|uniref:Uncharacterized protein n=1 Tax=Trichogramma kaykai TaxID=54128 RepID=A0ABD2X3B6_9HYME